MTFYYATLAYIATGCMYVNTMPDKSEWKIGWLTLLWPIHLVLFVND